MRVKDMKMVKLSLSASRLSQKSTDSHFQETPYLSALVCSASRRPPQVLVGPNPSLQLHVFVWALSFLADITDSSLRYDAGCSSRLSLFKLSSSPLLPS